MTSARHGRAFGAFSKLPLQRRATPRSKQTTQQNFDICYVSSKSRRYRWRCKMNGMDDEEDENNFSEDEFAGLDDEDFLVLEEDALQSTQQAQPVQQRGYARNAASRPGPWNGQPISQTKAPSDNPYRTAPRYGQLEDSHDEGLYADDGGVATPVDEKEAFIAPQNGPGEMIQREAWRQQRYSKPAPQPVGPTNRHPPPRPPARNVQQPPDKNYQRVVPEGSVYHDRSLTVEADDSMVLDDSVKLSRQEDGLRAQLETLQRERDRLAKELSETKSNLEAKQGEVKNIRAKQANETKVFERQLTSMKKSLQEDSVRNKERVDLIRQEKKIIEDEKAFLQNELADGNQRMKRLQRTLQEQPPNIVSERATAIKTTPKKAHVQSLRDGFDDDEIMAISPVKSGGGRKSKGSTPTGAKRKRKAVDASPVPALVLRQSGTVPPTIEDQPVAPAKPEAALPIIQKDKTVEKNMKFMQRILNHKSPEGTDRILEACMQYVFPSEPSKTFTSLLLAATSRLPPSAKRFKAELVAVFIDLWVTCLKQKYYRPIPLLMEVVSFIIALESTVVDEATIKLLLPVLQNCGKINAEARFNYSPVRQRAGKLKQIPKSELNPLCNGTHCLSLLYDLASRCQSSAKLIDLFWRSMDTDFVLMMLNSSQPIPDMTLMLNLLSTSVLPTTFGNIYATPSEQTKMETYIIRRVCYLLWETPRVDESLPPPTKHQTCHLRLTVMDLLSVLVFTSTPSPRPTPTHASSALASHPDALARLVRSIYDEVDAMYAHRASHLLHAALVNRGIHLLYHLLQLHPDIPLPVKLAAVNGGAHKHRVVLTRLAFSEGVFLDKGVDDETVGMARDMLEESVTPEEAEGLLDAFPEFARRGGGERGTQGEGQDEEMEMEKIVTMRGEAEHGDVIDIDDL